ncbi:hypothetical protein DM01DRAFT_1378383 [Hesseltinella vesiculosa]|uniref:Pentacotripeptide-repeat region of PRORP domain-containing protein n=1 Tax=Hesseltinella vesiculosa TaxID=101127 RepID=A0A1X2G495_9FUNG|nr:hypothetical protein DM01DRAFT_1378383 [Hesseltinella vesiculosa]
MHRMMTPVLLTATRALSNDVNDLTSHNWHATAEEAQDRMQQLAAHGNWLLAQDTYDQVYRHNAQQTATMETFGLLMEAYIRGDRLQDAMDIYYSLRDHLDRTSRKTTMVMDETFYGPLITASLDHGSSATHNGVSPHLVYTVDDGMNEIQQLDHDTSANLSFAMRLFQDMQQAGLGGTTTLYKLLLRACQREADSHVLKQVHRYLRMDDTIDLDDTLVHELIAAYSAVDNDTMVLELWDGYAPRLPATARLLLARCLDKKYKQNALRVWQSLPASLQSDLSLGRLVLDGLVRADGIEEARQVLASTAQSPDHDSLVQHFHHLIQ